MAKVPTLDYGRAGRPRREPRPREARPRKPRDGWLLPVTIAFVFIIVVFAASLWYAVSLMKAMGLH